MKVLHQSQRVHDVDFLPQSYRDRYARRKVRMWRILVVAAFTATLPTASLFQYQILWRLESQLQAVEQKHRELRADNARLAEVKSDLERVNAGVKLITYLGHPWPRTQILSAIVEALPAEIRLEELEITRGDRETVKRLGKPTESEEETETRQELLPASRDLATMRREFEGEIVVNLAGSTTSNQKVHAFLDRVANNWLIERAELESLESNSAAGGDDNVTRFQATVFVRPGYGMPGGPAMASTIGESVVAAISQHLQSLLTSTDDVSTLNRLWTGVDGTSISSEEAQP